MKNFKKFLSVALVLIMVLSAAPMSSFADIELTTLSLSARVGAVDEGLGSIDEELTDNEHNYQCVKSEEPTCDKEGYVTYMCADEGCDSGYTEIIAPLGHSHGNWVTIKDSSCSEMGIMLSACARCELAKVKYLDKTEHTVCVIDAAEPTCENTGLTEGSVCSVCGEILIEQEEIPALGHTEVFIEGKDPTCTEVGYDISSYCGVCFKLLDDQDIIPAKGHNIVTLIEKKPTCTEAGLTESQYCSECGETMVKADTIPALGHNYVMDWSVSKEPTCVDDGIYQSVCTNCGDIDKKTVDAYGHQEEFVPGVAADCVTPGLTDGVKCKVCGVFTVEQQKIEAPGHSFGNWKCTAEPTCDKAGERERICSVCNYCETESIPSFGGHIVVDIDAVEVTCEKDGLSAGKICERCGVILEGHKVVAPALGHNYIKDEAKSYDPDCTNDGKYYAKCSRCDSIDEYVIPSHGHIEKVIPGTPADCILTGLSDSKICEVCGIVTVEHQQTQPLGHDLTVDSKNSVPATCTENGVKVIVCSRCMLTNESEIPALGHTFDAWKTDSSASENGAIVETRVCQVCKFVDRRVLENCGHSAEIVKGIEATCTTSGITDGKICSTCGTMIVEQVRIPELGHFDSDKDGICDRTYCLYDLTADCRCNCHKSGFLKSMFNFKIFFQKLFRLNRDCKCGIAHY